MKKLPQYVDDPSPEGSRSSTQKDSMPFSKNVCKAPKQEVVRDWPLGYWDVYGALEDDTFVVPDNPDLHI